ncbi:SpaA isopeptide-forming pilin-related protein [Listeria seeligeri]|uniref:SpaA isopeptide-forming pilin-related protein n=1 Tax=Listeria seeligeri TaxID=1640 RepID=UPI0016287CD2|nr:SpaA isopeptide-forming pilin-related protein [Listeria seeligeri]MBC1444015.1 Cys-Gln thioester bond-forming surface protein [Listeria seeligeri]MBC1773721.1 Cys-Gln thioester bond-forming surface protein [Listeria seeligeri]MBF2384519.1 Cys-Gln thioester bond-forming surface protein [Listeria seeligeri]MBF2541755.1 Cys-Gln thioester bond-forming surface protein [Listeria seeligeri]MBF2590248.1 Cys-Gln thioester bond-forming surface protein [Listeria seeligeri]
MKKNNKVLQKSLGVLMVFATLFSTFFTSSTPVQASTLTLDEPTNYYYTGVPVNLGYPLTQNIYVLKQDNKKVFCIESGIPANSGEGYTPETFINAKKDLLSKIAYYGYTKTSQSHYDYAVTQVMIWEELGDQYHSSTIPNYQQRKAEIMAIVKKHDTLPSWHNQEVTIKVGDSLTLKDSNSVLTDMTLESNTTNAVLKQNGNTVVLTPSAKSNNGSITYRKVPQNEVGASIVYKKPNEQTMVEFHLDSSKQANLKVNIIKLGNVKVQKIDEDTGKPLPNTKLRFEYAGTTKDITTDANGIAEIKDIPQGTKVTITEVTAPNGFVNKGEIKTVTIEPNNTVEVRIDNKAQQGLLKLTKSGNKIVGIEQTKSDYGDLYSFIFDYRPLANVTYDIQAVEDVTIGGTTHAKAGDVVATVTTNDAGELTNMPYLYLGKYQAIEISAPAGFLIDSTPIPFEFIYAGQEIELVTESVQATNEFQSLKLSLLKNEERIESWSGNKPIVKEIPANEKVFGLFSNEGFSLENDVTLSKDSLLYIGTVEDGQLLLNNLQYPEGTYYFKELNAGTDHQLLEKHYDFEFKATDNQKIKEIVITENEDTPLLNKLHFNQFSLKKLNEQASLDKKQGYIFEYVESKGAIFTLEDNKETVIQTVTVDDKSLATFHSIPVGTFYLKEKKASSEDYVLTDETFRIESAKEGIQVFDENNTLIGEQKTDEVTILFELKNDLIKGNIELIKTDIITGEALPNTGVRILDEEQNVVIEGKTNEKGIFKFRQLPKGIYYFQEFEAPMGYQIDETPLKFEIKEDGETVKVDMTNRKVTTDGKLPQTGDSRNGSLYIVGVALSLTALTFILKRRKQLKDME